MKLTVVIPVHNAERYISACLDSVATAVSFFPPGQAEVICVDDGSTDGSSRTLSSYAKLHDWLRVIRQENAGPGVARNVGMDAARGMYLTFLDADDSLVPDGTLRSLVDEAEGRSCDVLCASARMMSEAGVQGKKIPWLLRQELTPAAPTFAGGDLGDGLFFAFGPVPWAKIYSHAFVQSARLRFLPLKRSEDFPFVQGALAVARQIAFDDRPLVLHRTGVPTSLERTKDETPCVFWEAEKAFLADLAARGAVPGVMRAAKLRAWHRVAYNLRAMRTFDGFARVFSALPEMLRFLQVDGAPGVSVAELADARGFLDAIASCPDVQEAWQRRHAPRVSVVIPVYNVETYLRRCLDSVLRQTLKEIEIICVDDGSTDGSSAILAEYVAKDPRVKVLTRERSNAGAARNAGMAVASGEWLFFSDADDTMTDGLLERLVSVAQKQKADLVISGYKQREDGVVADRPPPARLLRGAAPGPDGSCPPALFVDAGVSPWNKLFRRDTVVGNRLRFQEVPRHNDLLFVCLALALAEHPVAISTCGYIYNKGRPGCVSSVTTRPEAFVDVLLGLRRELDARGLWRKAGVAFANVALAHCCYHLLGGGDPGAFASLYRTLHDHALADLGLGSVPEDSLINRQHAGYLKAVLASADPTGLWMILLGERYQAWKAIAQRSMRIRELENGQAGLAARAEAAEARAREAECVAESLKRSLAKAQTDLAQSQRSVESLASRVREVEMSCAYRLGQMLKKPIRVFGGRRGCGQRLSSCMVLVIAIGGALC